MNTRTRPVYCSGLQPVRERATRRATRKCCPCVHRTRRRDQWRQQKSCLGRGGALSTPRRDKSQGIERHRSPTMAFCGRLFWTLCCPSGCGKKKDASTPKKPSRLARLCRRGRRGKPKAAAVAASDTMMAEEIQRRLSGVPLPESPAGSRRSSRDDEPRRPSRDEAARRGSFGDMLAAAAPSLRRPSLDRRPSRESSEDGSRRPSSDEPNTPSKRRSFGDLLGAAASGRRPSLGGLSPGSRRPSTDGKSPGPPDPRGVVRRPRRFERTADRRFAR